MDPTGAKGTAPPLPVLSRELSAADYFHRKLLEAKQKLQRGDYAAARRIAEAILVLDEDSPLAYELRRIVREARERLVLQELEPRIDPGELVYEIGEKPRLTFRLINRSRRPARVELERGILGSVTFAYTRRYLDGSWKRDERRVNLAIPETVRTLELEPGGLWEYEVPFALEDDLPLAGAVARVEMRATFRPRRWELEGEKDSNIPIHAAPAEFWIVPPGYKRLVEAPERRLVAALFFGRDELFLVAGWLCVWAGEKDPFVNEKLVETLVDALPELEGARRKLALQFLREATGKHLETPEEWREWLAAYRKERTHSREARGGDRAGSEPARSGISEAPR